MIYIARLADYLYSADIGPDGLERERKDYAQVVLPGRFRAALDRSLEDPTGGYRRGDPADHGDRIAELGGSRTIGGCAGCSLTARMFPIGSIGARFPIRPGFEPCG